MIVFINVFHVDPANQQRLVDILTKVTGEIVSKAKSFVSSTLHRRTDGSKVTIAIDIFFAPVRNCGKVFAVSECD